ncbi:hypothetical protein C4579_01015 [Candidatus Microgenomates bacterium]|nr:MAG: hypothetical protein C4579_01015 [Candidatus Microgenomates bacterium]
MPTNDNPKPISPRGDTNPTSQQSFAGFIQKLQSVKTNTPQAQLNKNSMVDAKGRRIIFNEDKTPTRPFTGVENPSKEK